jgi:hypothetical protein
MVLEPKRNATEAPHNIEIGGFRGKREGYRGVSRLTIQPSAAEVGAKKQVRYGFQVALVSRGNRVDVRR